ncbi:MAG: site-specific integrase [Muribaculaceae bacterium]|nr:site-specific integrase [Muribaculaceae bacterium]
MTGAAEEICRCAAGIDGEVAADALFERCYDRFLALRAILRQWTPNTLRSMRRVGRLVCQFAPHLRVGEIDREWLAEFCRYQHTHCLRPRRGDAPAAGYSNPVIRKNCSVLKSFLRWLADRGALERRVAEGWVPVLKTVRRPVIFLSCDELARFLAVEVREGSPMQRARDIFAFGCFTGLRYSDMMNLRKTDVKSDSLQLTTIKTCAPLRIELNVHSRRILERYAGLPGERALPHMDGAQLNLYIKKVAEAAGIDDPLTITQYYGCERREVTQPKHALLSCHAARRTFICTALALGIPPDVIMKWTGHSDYAAMRPYIDIADATRRTSMSRFDTLRLDPA